MAARRNSPTSRKDDILRAFATRVARDGYADTSIADLARDLGVSKGTIVHHFGTKLQLLERVQVDYMERRLAEAHHIVAVLNSPAAQIAGVLYALLRCHRDDRDATLTFTRELRRFAGDDELATVRTQRSIYKGLVRQIVARGVETGEFRTEDPDIVALQLFGMCNWAWTWYLPDGRASVEEIARTYAHVVLGGLVAGAADQAAIEHSIDEAFAAVRGAPVAAR